MNIRTVLPAILLILSGCHGQKDQQIIQPGTITVPDSTYIFNGNNLDGWEVTNFGPQGPVTVSQGEITLGMGDGCTGITYIKPFPEIDYKVCLEAKRVSGVDFFCGMTFPVGKDPCSLIIGGWGGTIVGLSSINGLDASENETTRMMKFELDRWYDICLEVREAGIKAWIDDSLVVDFALKGERLSVRPEVELSRPFGICSWTTTAALRNIRVKELDN